MSSSHLKRIDKLLVKYLRAMMMGKACNWDGEHPTAMSSAQVRVYWRVPHVVDELLARRLWLYQKRARSPHEALQVLGAIFGTCRSERHANITRMNADMMETEQSAPWAHQMRRDLQELARRHDSAHFLAEAYSLCDLFKGGQLSQDFVDLDLGVTRSFVVSEARIPPPGYLAPEREADITSEGSEEQPFE